MSEIQPIQAILTSYLKLVPIFNDSLDDVMRDFENGLEDAFTKDVEAEMDKITVLLTTFE